MPVGRATVSAVSGSTLTLTTFAGNPVTVDLSPSTTVTGTEAGSVSDLLPGTAITAVGPQNTDGTYTATRIAIGGAGAFGGLFRGAA